MVLPSVIRIVYTSCPTLAQALPGWVLLALGGKQVEGLVLLVSQHFGVHFAGIKNSRWRKLMVCLCGHDLGACEVVGVTTGHLSLACVGHWRGALMAL